MFLQAFILYHIIQRAKNESSIIMMQLNWSIDTLLRKSRFVITTYGCLRERVG